MTNYVLDGILFTVSVETVSNKHYIIKAIANGVVTFETDIHYSKNNSKTYEEKKERIIDSIKNSRITLSRSVLAEEHALMIVFEYNYTNDNGGVETDGYELYYQPHFTIEQAIEDAMKLKYSCK